MASRSIDEMLADLGKKDPRISQSQTSNIDEMLARARAQGTQETYPQMELGSFSFPFYEKEKKEKTTGSILMNIVVLFGFILLFIIAFMTSPEDINSSDWKVQFVKWMFIIMIVLYAFAFIGILISPIDGAQKLLMAGLVAFVILIMVVIPMVYILNFDNNKSNNFLRIYSGVVSILIILDQLTKLFK